MRCHIALRREPVHSVSPRQDFEEVLDEAECQIDQRCVDWYEVGLKRGINKALDWIGEGKIIFENDVFETDYDSFELQVKIKLAGRRREPYRFEIEAEDLGFK
jgi:hypothetical protein